MKIFPLLFCFILFFTFAVSAQNNQSLTCPKLDVSGGGITEIGQPVNFTANVIDSENRQFEYVWTVSGGGKIVAGQGTAAITVELIAEQNITVTVEVKGFPEGCRNTESDTLGCGLRPPQPNLFDGYGPLPNGEFKACFENFYVELRNNPNAQGYIINYGTDREIARREKQLRDVIASLNLDSSRITLVRGGANQRGKGVRTKVWIVPPGAENPVTGL
jgi:hypothetical protein